VLCQGSIGFVAAQAASAPENLIEIENISHKPGSTGEWRRIK
jgi:hypothetical protein